MIEIIKNKNNLLDREITEVVIRVKALIINSKKEILLGHSHCEYQFPGGHVEGKEDLTKSLKRELLEETGLEYDTSNLEPFAINIKYLRDYPKVGENRKNIIYYYEIKDDRIPDLAKTNYTEEEIDGNYRLRFIPLDILEDVLKTNITNCGDEHGIAMEMLELLSYYFEDKK